MTCSHCQNVLSPYLDHDLSSTQRKAVLEHLAQCSVCATQLAQLEESRKRLGSLPEREVPDALEMQLWLRLQDPRLAPVRASWWHSPRNQWMRWAKASRPVKWTGVSLGTLATATASLAFYFTTLQSPPEVSAKEVVASMDEVLDSLDPADGLRLLNEETPEEQLPDWSEEDAWLFQDGDSQTEIEDLWR